MEAREKSKAYEIKLAEECRSGYELENRIEALYPTCPVNEEIKM